MTVLLTDAVTCRHIATQPAAPVPCRCGSILGFFPTQRSFLSSESEADTAHPPRGPHWPWLLQGLLQHCRGITGMFRSFASPIPLLCWHAGYSCRQTELLSAFLPASGGLSLEPAACRRKKIAFWAENRVEICGGGSRLLLWLLTPGCEPPWLRGHVKPC